ncbi:EAL domain-containing protein [Pseudomonas chlororaphis]|uniref:GGDEF/EAL domain-containing response regulator n=1 Tax=Pseudomonas chlororaphis TaxID=587753 RepID=UPI0006A5D9E8|nr:EAL domain-containing protein [Pseudomonas chlororaphis]MBM0282685.1 EAL domain-containing protein [Pseudomonas chlororaphis]MDO1506681.1 EAL domain-containing protein [Pseudomonas chlororaphis]ORM45877.1 two-component system response regulator [Pseudomonas chlororaphis subsp. chlororaphis]TWR91948.1 EAL domain-containing protein [Pseudomonas chlororaphis subsp. chlororaphis]WDH00956.1 EAL domain-containing protein [Pseudomonas chlororaphis]
MMASADRTNRRILIVDDTTSIHEDFRKILACTDAPGDSLSDAEAALFGTPVSASLEHFFLDSAFQGREALDKVQAALDHDAPYAMAFIDMRMPPGWDGLETIERLWQVDPKLQIALCTAYSDYSWEDIAERLQLGDRLLILKKPFDAIEIRQMASALTVKWQMTEDAELKMDQLEQAVEERTRELADANIIVQNSPTILYRLRGEPSFTLMYISHNITKFGHVAAQLVASADWAQTLIHPDDQAKVKNAMLRILDRDVAGASIEFRMRTGDGAFRWVENRYIPVRNDQSQLVEVEGIILDITERRLAEEKMALMARTDSLTGLANRATLIERLHQAFAAARRGAAPFAMFYLDLDHFKRINDTLGHPIGDLLLQEVARRIKACTRENDVVARLGGDEFAILQLDVDEATHCAALATKIRDTLLLPYSLEGNEVRISVSIGISLYSPQTLSADSLMAQSDMALYRSKDKGRNQFHFHSEEINQEVTERVTLANDLKLALERDELHLHYLPEVDLGTGRILGMATQVRWLHPLRGWLEAEDFMPAAEKTGIVIALGHWLLDQACRQMRAWRDQNVAPPLIAIHLSLVQLKTGPELIYDVLRTTARWDLCPWDLRFDVTEGTLAQTKWTHNDILPRLCELGVKIAIDDFGTEYSSFDYLKTYRVNHLKLAQRFLDSASSDPDNAMTLRAILNFAREVGIGVTAEGVETQEQRTTLISSGTSLGHSLGAAVDSDQAGELLKARSAAVDGSTRSADPTSENFR